MSPSSFIGRKSAIFHSASLLVEMEIRHRFEDEDGLTWYDGLVIGVANMEFEVIYSGEEGICEFELLQDYMKSDLTIIH